MTRPVVLVACDHRVWDNYAWSATPAPYLEPIARISGALPLQLPTLEARIDLDSALALADGVVLTGSRSNVHPECYGAAASRDAEPFDRARDSVTLPLIDKAIRAGVPLLALCRGFQELNVARGGTLFAALHDEPGRMDHRAAETTNMDKKFRLAHPVSVRSGGELARIVAAPRIEVNSVHRQGIDRLGRDLTIEAEAPDGTVEAVSVADAEAFALGVQWHPEYWATTDAPSRAIFEAFGRAAHGHLFTRQTASGGNRSDLVSLMS